MKNKLLAIFATTLLCVTMFSGCANIGNNVGTVQYKVVDDHAEVVALPNGSTDTDIKIEDTFEGVPVTVIRDFAGCNLENASIIHIGKNVKTIEKWAFSNNQKLKKFDVSKDNESFCDVDGVLYNKDMTMIYSYPCNGAEKYVMPDTVETVCTRAFYKNENLTSITLSKSLKTIEEMAFFQCSKIEELKFPNTLEFIGKDTFSKCGALKSIVIPASIKEIKEYAFYNCTELKKVTVKKAEKKIKLGKQWYPTNNGIEMDDLKIKWPK